MVKNKVENLSPEEICSTIKEYVKARKGVDIQPVLIHPVHIPIAWHMYDIAKAWLNKEKSSKKEI